jgi:hypothetical protein
LQRLQQPRDDPLRFQRLPVLDALQVGGRPLEVGAPAEEVGRGDPALGRFEVRGNRGPVLVLQRHQDGKLRVEISRFRCVRDVGQALHPFSDHGVEGPVREHGDALGRRVLEHRA